jgi:hypothetical protein
VTASGDGWRIRRGGGDALVARRMGGGSVCVGPGRAEVHRQRLVLRTHGRIGGGGDDALVARRMGGCITSPASKELERPWEKTDPVNGSCLAQPGARRRRFRGEGLRG